MQISEPMFWDRKERGRSDNMFVYFRALIQYTLTCPLSDVFVDSWPHKISGIPGVIMNTGL